MMTQSLAHCARRLLLGGVVESWPQPEGTPPAMSFEEGKGLMRARFVVVILVALCAAAGALAVSAPAWAGTTHKFLSSFGSFQNPQALAVQQASGDVLVVNQEAQKVERFTAVGAPAEFSALGSNAIDGAGGGECPSVPADCDQTPQGGFSFGSPSQAEVAVDESGGADNGDVYVTDTFHNVVDIFAADGRYLGQLSETHNGGFGAVCGVAVDRAGNAYVADMNGQVHRFQPFSTPVQNSNFVMDMQVSACQLAVDAAGDVFAAAPFGGPVSKYDSAGNLQYALDSNPANGVAVDPASGDVYVAESSQVVQFDASSSIAPIQLGSFGQGSVTAPAGVAVYGATGEVFVSDSSAGHVAIFGPGVAAPDATTEAASGITETNATLNGGVNPEGTATEWEFEYGTETSYGQTAPASPQSAGSGSSEVPVSTELTGLQPGTTYHYRLVAIGENGTTHGADQTFTTQAPPMVDGQFATPVGKATATLNAQINPWGAETTYHFEYGPTESYGLSTGDATLPAAWGDQPATSEITGLAPNTTYHYRAVATNALGGPVDGPDQTFTTQPALRVDGEYVSGVTTSQAKLNAEINPLGDKMSYRFEYGPTESYGASSPSSDAPVGSGGSDVTVGQEVSGLVPDSEFHYRVVATNAVGAIQGPDQTFHTRAVEVASTDTCPNASIRHQQGSQYLPDCRAYELVSPPDKNGGNVAPEPRQTRSSASGDAVGYMTKVGFGDAATASLLDPYIAERSAGPAPESNGWITHAIGPMQDSGSPNLEASGDIPKYLGEFSEDLTSGVFFASSPIGPSPGVEAVPNLYVRDDLRKAGQGSYQLVTRCPFCETEHTSLSLFGTPLLAHYLYPRLDDESPDFGHVIFESIYNLTSDAPAQPALCLNQSFFAAPAFCRTRLYEWDHGTLRMAGVLEDGSPAEVSSAGQGQLDERETRHTISDGSDGHSRVFFTVPTDRFGNVGGKEGGEDLTGGGEQGELYARIDHATTVHLNASERTIPDQTVGENTYSPAQFLDATPNGERVFFKTNQALTDDALSYKEQSPVEYANIYMYDMTKPASDPHNLVLITPPGLRGGVEVIGTSRDGSYVYMYDGNASTIYRWHEGAISEVAPLARGLEGFIGRSQDWRQFPRSARVTADGHHLLYIDYDNRAGYSRAKCGNFGCLELYFYSADTGSVVCVSCDPTGEPPTDNAYAISNAELGVDWHEPHVLSEDGRYVFFDTAAALVPQDINGVTDAYEYDSVTGRLSLLSSGADSGESAFLDASSDGRNAFFFTRQQLVGWDKDTSLDVYDARVGGGFPEPVQPAAPCAGEECQGSLTGSPGAAGFSSASTVSAGNLKSVARADKGSPSRLSIALRACRKRSHKRRARHRCEVNARKRYGGGRPSKHGGVR
jgi:hypothetical protein